MRYLLIVIACLVSSATLAADDPLATLRREHPRLLVSQDDLDRARKAIESDPLAKMYHDQLTGEAIDKMLPAAPIEYKLVGPRLLEQSRTALKRISTLG